MGLRPHSALLLNPPGPIHSRMGLVIRGYGDLGVKVRSGWFDVEVDRTPLDLLGYSDDGYLLAQPRSGAWSKGTLHVIPRSYGDQFGEVVLTVGEDSAVASPPPSFDFKPIELRGSPGAPTQAHFFVGAVSGLAPLLHLDLFLSNSQVCAGWVHTGSHAAVEYVPPPEGVTVVGAIVRDLIGQANTYGQVPADWLAHTAPQTPWWQHLHHP